MVWRMMLLFLAVGFGAGFLLGVVLLFFLFGHAACNGKIDLLFFAHLVERLGWTPGSRHFCGVVKPVASSEGK